MNISIKPIVGITEYVEISGRKGRKIPAKIDTGADSSAIWATKIRVDKDGVLKFALFGEGSPYYSGKIFKRTDYSVAKVRSTTGHEQIRYRTHFKVSVGGKKIKMLMNLSDRSKNNFPILIGRRSLSGKFLIDPSKKSIYVKRPLNTLELNEEFKQDPLKFHKKYFKQGAKK